jgi:hypothetical protein
MNMYENPRKLVIHNRALTILTRHKQQQEVDELGWVGLIAGFERVQHVQWQTLHANVRQSRKNLSFSTRAVTANSPDTNNNKNVERRVLNLAGNV